MRKIAILFAALTSLVMPGVALATTTDCPGHVTQIWVADGGIAYIYLDSGFSGTISSSDPNFSGVFALATSAMMGGKRVATRVSGTSCSTPFSPIVGFSAIAQ